MKKEQRWWTGKGAERFWLELTDRADIGADLRAPRHDSSGSETWRYNLFQEAKVGDVVFHYDYKVDAIVGWSKVSGPPVSQDIVWVARGTSARARKATPTKQPGYAMPLSGYTGLAAPVTLQLLRKSRDVVATSVAEAKEGWKGPLYFPFELSAKRPIRPLQGYSFKLPASFVSAFPQLSIGPAGKLGDEAYGQSTSAASEAPESTDVVRLTSGQGWGLNAAQRKAVEVRAMAVAETWLTGEGYTFTDVHKTSSYDYLADRDGETKIVEVKGTTGLGESVLLTKNEVAAHQQRHPLNILIVVHGIQLTGGGPAKGGSVAAYEAWKIEPDNLTPIAFDYRLLGNQ